MRRIVSLLTAGLLMTAVLLTLPAASASAQTCLGGGCGANFGFFPQNQVGDCDFDDPCNFNGDFDADDFGLSPVNQGFLIGDFGDCDFVAGLVLC